MQRVRQLPQQLVERIRTGLTLDSLPQAVVEVLANSLDAHAQNIVIRLGAPTLSFTVEDDGHGVRAEDLDVLGSRYSTSKLRGVTDLAGGIQTLGFRGEAVASLITNAAEVCITTRGRGSFETLTKTTRSGGSNVAFAPSTTHLKHSGTIISVKQFLFNQPVRSRQLLAQTGDIEARTIQAVLRMALPFVNVSVTLLRAPTGHVLLHLPQDRDLRSLFSQLVPEQAPTLPPMIHLAGERGYGIRGLLGSLKACYPHQHHQYLYVNRRHVIHTSISALLNAHFLRAYLRAGYHLSNRSQQQHDDPLPHSAGDDGHDGKSGSRSRNNSSSVRALPAFLVAIECPYGDYDVTSEPDKSGIVFKHLPIIHSLLKSMAAQAWGADTPLSTYGDAAALEATKR
ncbi:hypothetical protein GPECTOR_4g884 [Gonium pectorale]|uniref:DNA mismatch repair protein S5 domain-containing protein n=1 Tax=Gonium pectorale TaxID=33097 RepID=A0A150GYH8_GONPE|nr:hypothetical protein GPECTOR_4g884 [Gonium pectorale]|eukprot:KXZ54813.1 hypothetical protein GPECTOR_4g884 [Gonium pectorale]